jgi:glycine/D-amino acid oxidase-like deaminating enzyme
MNSKPKAYLIGGGIGSLAAAAFLIRDGKLPGQNISILEAAPVMGGSLDGGGDPDARLFDAWRAHADNRQLRMHVGSLQVDSLTDEPRTVGVR